MADDVQGKNIVLVTFNNAVHKIYSLYIPVIHEGMKEATSQAYHAKSERHVNS